MMRFVPAVFHFAVYVHCLCWAEWAKYNLPAIEHEKKLLPMAVTGIAAGMAGIVSLFRLLPPLDTEEETR
jgi:hypothetical protein